MQDAKAIVYEGMRGARAWVNRAMDARWDNDPFGRQPHASREEYLRLFEETRRKEYPQVDAVEAETGFAVDRAWLDDLALHTQIVKKKSDLGYPHGRLLYSILRRYIAHSGERFVTVVETGTARGFSALCMAKAIADAGIDGRVVTVDVLPHLKRQIWNCIDDHEGRKSRAELLAPWSELARKVVFLQGDTLYLLPRIGVDRVNFAFLDAQHIRSSVLHEFGFVAERQQAGDMVFFDDVTPAVFPGVVQAVDDIEAGGQYEFKRLTISDQRAYAWARRR
ncbi:MAG: class I SAM-dependent methyltransferase [Parcubacteria group bacterium]